MGTVKVYPPVKYFTAITFEPTAPVEKAKEWLETIFSDIEDISPCYNFDHFTSYYHEEMGTGLQKQIVSFKSLKPAEILPECKLATNEIESHFLSKRGRRLNLDPGYICAAKMILATTKDYDHRLYLHRGIFGDVHLRFRQGHFQPAEWTYPDYRQPQIILFFEQVRKNYLQQLKDLIL